MCELYKKIESLLNGRNITAYRMCKDIGISAGIMTDLKSGRKQTLSAETMDKIARYFGVSVSYLLGTSEEADKITVGSDAEKTDVDRELENLLQNMSDDDKRFVIAYAKGIVDHRK